MAQPTRFSTVSIGFPVGAGAAPPDIAVLSVGSTNMAGIKRVCTGTSAVSFGVVSALDLSSLTVAVAGVEQGDSVIMNPGSNWSGDANYINIQSLCEEADGVVTVLASNTSNTDIAPPESTFRFTGISF